MENIKPFENPIYITRPTLPLLTDVYQKIKEIWDSKWLTNMGIQHQTLKSELMKYLNVKFLSLFCNGTIALELACHALNLTGEVITTPFTFPATINSLYRNNLSPVLCDIENNGFNIQANGIEELITSNTSAIMPVHVFGIPCEIEKIEKIAKKYNLKVIYDAAHCFNVKYKGRGIGTYGDISMFSFHATKIFHTLEGGALTFSNPKLKEKLYLLKNFGIKNEEEVILPGTNGKMNELQAAIGLLNLQLVDEEIKKRKKLFSIYSENLKDLDGIKVLDINNKDIMYNYQYFPVLIEKELFGYSRDQVYNFLKKYNIFSRKYFYPLCVDYQFFKLNSQISIPHANKIANQVLCLPIYGELKEDIVKIICNLIKNIR